MSRCRCSLFSAEDLSGHSSWVTSSPFLYCGGFYRCYFPQSIPLKSEYGASAPTPGLVRSNISWFLSSGLWCCLFLIFFQEICCKSAFVPGMLIHTFCYYFKTSLLRQGTHCKSQTQLLYFIKLISEHFLIVFYLSFIAANILYGNTTIPNCYLFDVYNVFSKVQT